MTVLTDTAERVTRAASAGDPRTDIQGLRAVAVGLVVVYHLVPYRLTGGYVGVDVFFVISGFLITSHLLRKPVLTVTDLLDFWARRVRRLIPAASLVLLATVGAAALWLPTEARVSLGSDVVTAASYVSNWRFATSETDYMAAGRLPSAVQHYWSLSIEEQFYALWPVLLGLAALAAVRLTRRRAAPERATFAVVAATVVLSLGWSASYTAANPAPAYFVSTTRAWELALGGLVAATPVLARHRWPAWLRAVIAWTGLAAIAYAALTFTEDTVFPGLAALVPTVGAAFVIVAAADGAPTGPGRMLGARPAQWLGDHSYSVYLWHWPLVVVLPFALGRTLTRLDIVGVVVASLFLAAVSRRWVEERLRWHPRLAGSRRATFALLAGCALVVGGAGAALTAWSAGEQKAQAAELAAAIAGEPCVGADAARDSSCTDPVMLTTPEQAAADKSTVYADECWNHTPFRTRLTCTYGPADASTRIALLGNSHAGHWVPAFQDALEPQGWSLTTYLQSVCYTVDIPLVIDREGASEACGRINEWAISSIVDGGYDLVVLSDRTQVPLEGVADADKTATAKEAYGRTLAAFTDAGLPVLVLRDTPAMAENVPECLALHEDGAACDTPREQAIEPDPLASAALDDASGLVTVVDVNDLICDEAMCHPVVGGLITNWDNAHMTASFARTLAPEVVAGAEAALGSS